MRRRLFTISSCLVCLSSAVKLQSCCESIRRLARSVSILIFSTWNEGREQFWERGFGLQTGACLR